MDPRNPGFNQVTDCEAAHFTDRSFRLERWRNQPALVSKDGMTLRPYTAGEEFDSEVWDLVPDAWDHEHCAICWNHICDFEDHGFREAYLNDSGEWVCPPCFERYFRESTAAGG